MSRFVPATVRSTVRPGTAMQERSFHEACCRKARLSGKQKAQLASIWYEWKRRRESQDTVARSVHVSLSRLPTTDDFPVTTDFIARVSRIADGSVAVSTLEGSRRFGSARARALAPAPLGPAGFLGECVWQQEVAASALRALHDAQRDDINVQNEFAFTLSLPSKALEPTFHLLVHDGYLDVGIIHFDHLLLCRTAAEEEKHGQLFTGVPLERMFRQVLFL
jgi:hypothetical protein